MYIVVLKKIYNVHAWHLFNNSTLTVSQLLNSPFWSPLWYAYISRRPWSILFISWKRTMEGHSDSESNASKNGRLYDGILYCAHILGSYIAPVSKCYYIYILDKEKMIPNSCLNAVKCMVQLLTYTKDLFYKYWKGI